MKTGFPAHIYQWHHLCLRAIYTESHPQLLLSCITFHSANNDDQLERPNNIAESIFVLRKPSAYPSWHLLVRLSSFTPPAIISYRMSSWELVSSLHYDWKLIRRPSESSPWVKWTYLACRYLMLGAMMNILIVLDIFDEMTGSHCKVLAKCLYAFPYFSHLLASVLIAVRVVAIWAYDRRCVVTVIFLLCAQTIIYTFDVIRANNTSCHLLRTQNSQPYLTVSLVADFTLLVIMLAGLLRLKEISRLALWNYLWTQGLIWLALATIAEVPAIVFIWLNLNQVMNLMFLVPEVVIVVISATRMYRTLSGYTKSHVPSWTRPTGPPPFNRTVPGFESIPMQHMRVSGSGDSTFSDVDTAVI